MLLESKLLLQIKLILASRQAKSIFMTTGNCIFLRSGQKANGNLWLGTAKSEIWFPFFRHASQRAETNFMLNFRADNTKYVIEIAINITKTMLRIGLKCTKHISSIVFRKSAKIINLQHNQ